MDLVSLFELSKILPDEVKELIIKSLNKSLDRSDFGDLYDGKLKEVS